MELIAAYTNELLLLAAAPEWLQAMLGGFWNLAKVAIGLGLVIFVHELGHFMAAKACGVKVEKFYVGFDVPIRLGPIRLPGKLLHFTRGETEYGIGAIPLGGYVRMLGQDDDPRNAESESERIRIANGQLDPRSYPAKPVWQRMTIISAGVVMNLIFAVIFAACAYGWGVSYVPTLINSVTPGDPAWNAGVRPGGKVVAVANLDRDEHIYFREMKMAIFGHGLNSNTEPLRLTVNYPSGDTTYSILPTRRHDPSGRQASIGVAPVDAAQFPTSPYAMPNSMLANVLQDGDFKGAKVVSLDGKPLPKDDESENLLATPVLRAESNRIADPLTIGIEVVDATGKTQQKTIEVPPQREKSLGFRWQVGEVTGVIPESPASVAGLKIGDRIVAINDMKDIDAVSLWQELHRQREAVTLEVVRAGSSADAAPVQLKLEPQAIDDDPGMQLFAGDFGVGRWGIAFTATPTLAGFAGDVQNAPQAGDKIKKVKLQWTEKEVPSDLVSFIRPEFLKEGVELSATLNPGTLVDQMQRLPVGTEILVLYERENKIQEVTLKLAETEAFWPERGFLFSPLSRIHETSFAEAVSLGFRETKRKLGDVFNFLGLIFSGKVSKDMVGGPLGIVYVANSEAAQGIPRLLLFLTLLSANLAVLNFLPIPALDGGHMVFLIAEWVRGKPVDEQLQMRLTVAGVLGLLALMVFVFINDLAHLTGS